MKDDNFSVDVITRILSVLSDEGNMKRTVLAGKARLNYAALIRYLKFLNTLRWVDFTADSGSLISITTIGRSFRKLLEKEDSPPEISEEVIEKIVTGPREEPAGPKERQAKRGGDSPSCLFCGNIIKGSAITKDIDDERHSFDKRECATLFMKFRDIYGKEFIS